MWIANMEQVGGTLLGSGGMRVCVWGACYHIVQLHVLIALLIHVCSYGQKHYYVRVSQETRIYTFFPPRPITYLATLPFVIATLLHVGHMYSTHDTYTLDTRYVLALLLVHTLSYAE